MESRSAASAASLPPPQNLEPAPRVVVIGGGISGLSAATHLLRHANFRLLLLEASPRLGGRVRTSAISSAQVELGATWIHGVEGSPVHEIATRRQLRRSREANSAARYERCDGFPPRPTLLAEGGLVLDDSLVDPVLEAFSSALAGVKRGGATGGGYGSTVGGFVRQGLFDFLQKQRFGDGDGDGDSDLGVGWSLQSIQEAVYNMQEDAERLNTASDSLFDLDLESEHEYREFGGEHVTIAGGYDSVVAEMAASLPPESIQLRKKVSKIVWNRASSSPVAVCCEDGSLIEADHVILTVSLGVLKSATAAAELLPEKNGGVRRSVDDLKGSSAGGDPPAAADFSGELFDPPLPIWKLQSISRLGFGVVDKLFLELDPAAIAEGLVVDPATFTSVELVYRRSSDSVVPPWMRKTFSVCPIYQGSNVLLCWFAGQQALEMEGLSEEEIIEGVTATLQSFGLVRRSAGGGGVGGGGGGAIFRKVLRSSWASDPLYKGSYTFVAAGASGKDIEALAAPLPLAEDVAAPLPLAAAEEGGMWRSISATTMSLSSSGTSTTESESEFESATSSEGEEEECFGVGVGRAGGRLTRPPLQLLFAGEATHRNYYSTTHGAFLSGVREADRLLQFYGYGKF